MPTPSLTVGTGGSFGKGIRKEKELDMRRYPFYIAIAAALLAVSCTENLEPELPVAEGEGIVLQLNTIDPVTTRAGKDGVKPGEDPYNENSLGTSVDIFFYASNADDSTPAITSLSAPVNTSTHQVTIPTSTAELRTIFSGHTTAGSKCKVFVIANYNGTTAINHERQTGYTRSELDGLLLATPTWENTDPNSNPNFVMSGEAQLTLQGLEVTPPVSGSVDMSRVASKVTFSISVADEITVDIYKVDGDGNRIHAKDPETGDPLVDEEGNPVYEKEEAVMTPHKDAMTVALCFANTYSTLSGTPYISPVNETTDANLFDYPYRHLTASATNSGFYDAEPFYSYPQTWAAGAARQPYLKLIIPWEKKGGTATTKNYYYKIPIPDLKMLRNNWYQIALTVSILGGEEHTPLPVELNYCVAPWNNPTPSAASVVAARYLSLSKTEFFMYNTTELSIPYVTSHDCEIVNARWHKEYYGTNTSVVTDGDASGWLSLVEDSSGGHLVKFNHALNNEINASMDVTPYRITFTIRHSDEDGHAYYREVTITQYPGIYMLEPVDGGNTFVDGYYARVRGRYKAYNGGAGNSSAGTTKTRPTPYGVLVDNLANNERKDMTVITVTAFTESSSSFSYTVDGRTETYNYVITDPRTNDKDWNDLTPYWGGSGAVNWSADAVSAIKVASTAYNYIAPQFMIVSMWGRNYGNSDLDSLEKAQKRCATYQEAGYPAGRWRLPTDAEVMFIINLQRYQFINNLFVGYYWTSSGSRLNGTNMNNVSVTRNSTQANSIRCVYDTWYWGIEPVADPYTYTIWPENTSTPSATAAQVN